MEMLVESKNKYFPIEIISVISIFLQIKLSIK